MTMETMSMTMPMMVAKTTTTVPDGDNEDEREDKDNDDWEHCNLEDESSKEDDEGDDDVRSERLEFLDNVIGVPQPELEPKLLGALDRRCLYRCTDNEIN